MSDAQSRPREPQYPLIQAYTLNYRGLTIMIFGIFLEGYWDFWVGFQDLGRRFQGRKVWP